MGELQVRVGHQGIQTIEFGRENGKESVQNGYVLFAFS